MNLRPPSNLPRQISQNNIRTNSVLTSRLITPNPYSINSPQNRRIQNTNTQFINHQTRPESHSRIEYVPYERKCIQYQTKQFIDRIPIQKTVTQYKQVKRIEYVPKERIITDYYTIQHQIDYIPQTIPQKVIQYVPVEKLTQRIEYIPLEKKIVHYPHENLQNSNAHLSPIQPRGSYLNLNSKQTLQNMKDQRINLNQVNKTSKLPKDYPIRQPNYENFGYITSSNNQGHFTTPLTGAGDINRQVENNNLQTTFINEITQQRNPTQINFEDIRKQDTKAYGIKVTERSGNQTINSMRNLQKNSMLAHSTYQNQEYQLK